MSGLVRALMVALVCCACLPMSVHAGGRPAPGVHLSVAPTCFAVGQRVNLTITLTGVRPAEEVAFGGRPAKAGFGGGDLGLHTANMAGTIFFGYPAPTMFDREVGVWIISAYRHSGSPPYSRTGSVWLAAIATFTVAPRHHLRPLCIPPAGGPSPIAPSQVVAHYFADLNARNYYAAWLLEASCAKGFTISNGPGAPPGWEGWQGRGPWQQVPPGSAAHPILASAHVTRITQLQIPILNRHHILVSGVAGWYTFDYTRVPWANMKHRNGFHVIKIAMWRCNGRWGVEPGAWLVGSGGELTWE